MAAEHFQFEERAIARLPYADAGNYVVRDTEVKGFILRVGKRTKTFFAEGGYWRDGFREFNARVKLGEFGDITAKAARAQAKIVIGAIAKGDRPGEEPKKRAAPLTLRQAWDRYRVAHMERKERSAGTIANYRDHMERLMGDWLDLPLGRLGRQPKLVADRHEKISAENGPYIANHSMRSLRAIYNHARRSHPDLPPVNPTVAVDWNREERRDTGMGDASIGAWLQELAALENLLRREFHLFVLLSGSRPTAIKLAQVEHLDLQRRVLAIPRPKGGAKKAFVIPLSRPMMRCLIRAIRLGRILYPDQARSWLFPAASEPGHLIEHKEDRTVLSKWGNELRQSYRTIAQTAGVSELDIHLLMNHSLPGVNAGYITRSELVTGHLRKQQSRISERVMTGARSAGPAIEQWLGRSVVRPVIPPQAQVRLVA
jgi:integrase